MAHESVVDQIVKSLSFEVEAVPQDNATKLTSTSNSTPLNVRIRVRKKDESDIEHGILSVPRFGNPDANPERIRLISSDQTIMSFNVSMEADFVKKPKRKPRKLFFGGCLGTQYDDDEVPYIPSSAYNAKITDTSSSSKSDGVIRQKFTLSKTKYDNTDALQQYSKKHNILGKCKPGGCLDPPFSEEKYSYEPMQTSKEKKPSLNQDAVKQHAKIRLHKVDNSHRTSKESKQLSKDSLVQKLKVKTYDDSTSILSIYDNSLQGSLDSKYSDSVITYPPLTSPSAITNEKNSRNRISSDEKPKKSYDDSIDAFFSSPRKGSRFSEITYNSADETKRENAKTITPIPLPIPIPVRNPTNGTDNTKRENTNTVIPEPLVNATSGIDDIQTENTKTVIPKPLANTFNDTDNTKRENTKTVFQEPLVNATNCIDDIQRENTKTVILEPLVNATNDIDDIQRENTKSVIPEPLENVTNSTDDIKRQNTKIVIPESLENATKCLDNTKRENAETIIPIPLENAITTLKTSPQIRDIKSPKETDMELEPTVKVRLNKADLSINNAKNDDFQKQSSYTDSLENDKTSVPIPIPIPIPLKNATTISSLDESHITLPQIRDSVSPKKTDLESEPTITAKVDKADLEKNNAIFDDLQEQSSFTDNLKKAKTSIPIPIPFENATTISKSGRLHTMISPHVQDSVSPKRNNIETERTVIAKTDKVVLSTNNSISDDSQEPSSYTVTLDDLNNGAKIAQPLIQSSHTDSNKSLPFSKVTQDKNDILSYREPYGDSSKLLEKISEIKLDDKEPVMQDQHESTSINIQKHGEKESFASIAELKTQINNYHPEKVMQNQNRSISNQNGLQSNGYISEDSKQKTLPKESANSLKDPDIRSGRFVNSDKQAENISQQSYADYIPEEYDHTNIIKNNENLAEENLKKLNKLSYPTATTIAKDDKRKKNESITEISTYNTAINSTSDNSIEHKQEIAKNKVNDEGKKTQPDSNKDYSERTEFILQEKHLSPDKTVQQDNTEDTLFDNENNVTNDSTNNDQDTEPIKYNRFLKPVNEGNSKSNIHEEDDNLTMIPDHTRSTPDHQQLSYQDFSRIETIKDPSNDDSKSKQSIFDIQSTLAEDDLNVPSSTAISKTNEEQSPDMPIDKSEFVDHITRQSILVETHKYTPSIERISTQSNHSRDSMRNEIHKYRGRPTIERNSTQTEQSKSFMRNETHKYRPSVERISIQAEQRKDSVNSSKLRFKLSSASTNGKDSVENKMAASELSPQTSLTKGSISLDLAFQSYVNDKNERTLKTIDTSIDHVRYPDDSITVIQSQLRPKVNEIRIPIDMDNDMTIQIHPTKSPTQPLVVMEHEPFDLNKPMATLSKNFGLSDLPNVNNYDMYSQERHENISYTEIPSILNSVYEQELIPLQNTINHLKKEIDSLASQQSILIDKLVSARRTKPTRLLRVSSRCICYR